VVIKRGSDDCLLPDTPPVSTAEIMHYGGATEVTPEKQCKRDGGPLEVVERASPGLNPWDPVLPR